MRRRRWVPAVCGLCLFLSLSCADQPQGLRVASGGNKRETARPVFAAPILLKQSPFVLIPF